MNTPYQPQNLNMLPLDIFQTNPLLSVKDILDPRWQQQAYGQPLKI
jgi:hypothetical protein